MGKGRPLTEFEKNLREEIFKRDNHIENSVKYAIDRGDDYGVLKNTPQWRRDAIEKYKNEHKTSVFDDAGNEVGKISYEARRAIRKNKISDYTPQNDDEKRVFDYLKNRRAESEKSASELKKKTSNELFSLKNNKNRLGGIKPDVVNLHDRAAVKNEYSRTESEANKYKPDDNEIFEIPVSPSRTVKLKYGIKNKIDNIAGEDGIASDLKAKRIDEAIEKLNLSEGELSDARSYAGIKKLELASASNGKNSFIKEISQPAVKFLMGTRDMAEGAAKFLKNGGKLNGDYSEEYANIEKYYEEHPDELGNDLFDTYKSGMSNPKGDYLRNTAVDKTLEAYTDTTKASQFIGDAGFRSAGQMMGASALAYGSGAAEAVSVATNLIKNAAAGTKAAKAISKAASIAPKISELGGSGAVSRAANTVIKKVNSLSVGKALKFLNPFDNPTTVIMGMNAAQDKYDALKKMGYDDDTSKKNALFSGYVSAITEKMGYDGKPESFFFNRNGKPIAGSATASKSKNAKKLIKDYLTANVSEGVEEIYNTVFERMGDYLSKVGYVDENGQLKQRKVFGNEGIFDIKDMGENFLGGFVGGAVMGSVGVLGNIASYDTKTVHEYADEVKKQVSKSNELVEKYAKESGMEAVSLPSEPDWKKASVNEINDYYEKAIDAHLNILFNENVIKSDSEKLDGAEKLIATPDDSPSAYADDEQIHDASENLSENNAGVSVQQLESGVKKLTDNLTTEYKSSYIKNIPNYQTVYNENLRLSSTPGKVVDEQFIRTYALSYAEGLRQNNSKAYKKLSAVSDDVGQMLSDYILRNKIPQGIETNEDMSALYRTAGGLKRIINRAANAVMSANNQIYGKSDTLTETANEIDRGNYSVIKYENAGDISLSKVGEYYEAYGTDAVKLKNLIPVSTHYTERNGSKTLVAAIPAGNINEYIDTLKLSANAYSAGGREFISLTPNTANATNGNGTDVGKADVYESDSNIEASENEISVLSKPTDTQVSEIALVISRNPSIPLILNGNEKLGETVLFYAEEEDASRNRIENDINSYYDGVMPEIGSKIPNEYDENMKFSVESVDGYSHVYNVEKADKGYLDYSNTDIETAIENIRNGNTNDIPSEIEVARLNPKTVKKISDVVGFDISDYKCKIEKDTLLHIEKRHGLNGKQDQSLADPKDVARMGYVINNADNVSLLKDGNGDRVVSKKYNDRNNTPCPILMISKRIDGTYCVSQVVPDSKKKTVWVTSARIQKADVGSQVPNTIKGQQLTSETPLVSSPALDNTNISQNNDVVNSSIRENAENDTDMKFSVDESFAAKYDRWVENGGNYRQTLDVGRTSDALKSIGVPDKKITWDTAKIAKIKEKHNVDDNIIKQVPYILEEPIVIMKSLQKSSRITLCGEVYDLNNKPVMAILELNPTNAKGNILLDEIKLVSAYGKDNLQNLINKSEILYVEPNKKRTNDWLTQNRLQLPLGQTNHRYNTNISQNDSVVNSNIRENAENDTRINTEDVKAIQSMPKKSVNDFTSEDIKKTENFAKKYYSEMGEKSPFFRAWFGDWRANDKSEVAVAERKGAVRGATKNLDTGWNIQISGKVFNETKGHNAPKNKKALPYLDYINSIVENAVLLDSYTVPSDKAKSSNSAMMHSLYAIADMGNGRELVKLYVEELNDVNSDGTIKRAYQLQNINKILLESNRFSKNSLASSDQQNTYTVSQLFDFVKRLDKNFKPNEVSKVVNADGTPRVVYHGTDSDFTVFDIMQTGKNFNDMSSGMFFFTKYKDGYPNSATDYARHSSENNGGNPNIMGAYLDIKKPLILDSKGYYSTNEYYDINAENIYEKFLGGDYDGVIVENSDNSSDDSVLYVVDSSSRIKSATDNIGTFDRGNDDIRFSTDENTDVNVSGDEDMSYLSEPVKNIKNDIREVRLRAEASHGKVFDRKDINEVCDSILNNVNTGAVRGIEIKSKKDRTVMSVLVNRVLNSAGVDAKRKHTRALARFIAQNATAYDSKSLSAADGVDYESDKAVITSYIKHGVKLSPDAKEAVISVVGEGSAKGYISMMSNENALGIDAVYDELRLVMPEYFTEDLLSDGDKMRRVMEVYTWLKEGRDLQEQKLIDIMDESDRREFTDILSQQLDDAFETRGRESLLDLELVKERQKQEKKIKALEDKYRDKISELRSKAENKVKNSAEKKKIEVKQERYKFKSLSEAVSKYGRIKEGEKPYRETAVPRKIDKDRYVSRFARTMVEAGVTPNEALSEFEERILSGDMTYERITDEKAKNYAEEKIKRRGFLKSLEDWDEMILSNQRIGKNEMAFGQMLYNQCINAKDAKHAMKIAADLATIATQAGQAVQACRLLKQMSPDCQLYSLEQAVSKMEDEFRQQLKLLSGKNRDIDIKINESLAQEYLNAETQEERDIVMDKLLEDIADQIPPSLKDKWDSWRYLSMLGNPRTHIRNIGGNLVFMLPVHLKNTLSYIAEKAISKGQRTKSYIKTAESKEFAKQDYIKMKDIIQGNSGKFEGISKINELRRIYKFKPLEGLRKANFAALEWEDGIFLKHHYENALAQIMTARGYTAEFLNSGTNEARAALEAARVYAINEAQKATYRDANAAAEALSSAQRKLQNHKYFAARAAGLALEGVVPFKKTPLNIVKRGVEYSPVGLINGVYDMAFNIKSGKATAAEAIDKLASGLVGTALTVLGMWLASVGLVRGDGDDDKNAERLDNVTGEQSYSVRIGKHSYTIDWVAPASMPFFVGVNIQKAFASDKKFTFEDIVKALVKIPDPIMSLSVLSSLSDLLSAGNYADTGAEKAAAYAWQTATSYVGQAYPTMLGQVARTIDKTKRNMYYADTENGIPDGLERFINRQLAKTPGASRLIEPKIDMWGREETYGDTWYGRFVGNTLSPGYYKEIDSTALDDELRRLNEEYEGDGSVLPPKIPKYFTYEKQKYYMKPSEYTKYSVIRGQKSFEAADELIRTDDYKNKSAEEKKKALEKCYDAAADEAKNEILKGRGIDVTAKEAEKERSKKSKSKSGNKRFR